MTKDKHNDVWLATGWANCPLVLVDGVPMSPSDVSHLARRLQEDGHTELAMRVGLAVDTTRRTRPLNLEDRVLILSILEGCPDALVPLRARLKERRTRCSERRDDRVSAGKVGSSHPLRRPSSKRT